MKIICTQSEKKWFVDALYNSPICPLEKKYCGKWGCRECVEKSIEWEVTDGS